MSEQKSAQFTSIGGQAVIEGVMMRSPRFIAVAVRKANRRIVIRAERLHSWSEKFPILKKPVLRGVATLVESMVHGMKALSFSAQISSVEESGSKGGKEEELSTSAILFSMGLAFVMGMGLFVALPHGLAALVSALGGAGAQSPVFHALDGVFKLLILFFYIFLIGKIPDIHRVFQYHGGEHQSIYTFEKKLPLTVENAAKQTRLHPRCGTSFLFFLIALSILIFSAVFPLFGLSQLHPTPWINHLMMVGVKMLLMFPVAGISYEWIKACSYRMDRWWMKAMMWPGLMLQNLTTRVPDAEHLEVALASLTRVLVLEQGTPEGAGDMPVSEIEIGALSELDGVKVSVTEFLES